MLCPLLKHVITLNEKSFMGRSKLYIDGTLLVDDDGLHGMVERCATRFMTAGLHSVYVTGFQAWGGVGMEIRYSGPDTGNSMTFMRVSPLPSPPAAASNTAGAPAAAAPPSAAVSAPAVALHGSDKSAQLNMQRAQAQLHSKVTSEFKHLELNLSQSTFYQITNFCQ